MKKKGVSHLEFILSFIIFAGAITAALYFFSPENDSLIVERSFVYLFTEIEKNASIEIESFSVRINSEEIPTETEIIAIEITNIPTALKVHAIIQDEGEQSDLQAEREGDIVYLDREETGWSGIDFIRVEYGEDFSEDSVDRASVYTSFYNLSSRNSEKVISETRFMALKAYYDTNYESLKEDFNMPSRANFGFSLAFEGSSIIAERPIPDGFETFIDKKRIKVLRTDESIVFAELEVQLW